MSMNELNTQLDYLAETKNLLKTAITDKGQNIEDNTPFRDYVEKVNDISTLNTETADATASAYELLNGKTAYVRGEKITGTLTTNDMAINGTTKFVQDDTVLPLINYYTSGTFKGEIVYLKKSQIDMSILEGKQYTIIYYERKYTKSSLTDYIGLSIIVFDDNTTKSARNDNGLIIFSYNGENKADMTVYSATYNMEGHSINDFKWSDFKTETKSSVIMSTTSSSGKFYIYNAADYTSTTGLTQSSGFKNMSDKYLLQKTILDPNVSQFYAKYNSTIYTPIDKNKLATSIGLTSDKIVKGNTILGVVGNAESGIDTSDATATESDITQNKTAYVNGTKLTGTIDTYSGSSFTSMSGSSVTDNCTNPQGDPQAKYVRFIVKPAYINGTFSMPAVDSKPICFKENAELGVLMSQSSVAEAIGLTADKIVSGNTILSIAGTAKTGIDTSDGTATADDMLENKTAYVNGKKLTGTIWEETAETTAEKPFTMGCTTIDISSDEYVEVIYQFDSDSRTYAFRPSSRLSILTTKSELAKSIGLTADVIKKGVKILGITGTYEAEQEAQEQIQTLSTTISNSNTLAEDILGTTNN